MKEVPYSVPGDLDLNVSDDEEFSPDKLRAAVERFYMTCVLRLKADPFPSMLLPRGRCWRSLLVHVNTANSDERFLTFGLLVLALVCSRWLSTSPDSDRGAKLDGHPASVSYGLRPKYSSLPYTLTYL